MRFSWNITPQIVLHYRYPRVTISSTMKKSDMALPSQHQIFDIVLEKETEEEEKEVEIQTRKRGSVSLSNIPSSPSSRNSPSKCCHSQFSANPPRAESSVHDQGTATMVCILLPTLTILLKPSFTVPCRDFSCEMNVVAMASTPKSMEQVTPWWSEEWVLSFGFGVAYHFGFWVFDFGYATFISWQGFSFWSSVGSWLCQASAACVASKLTAVVTSNADAARVTTPISNGVGLKLSRASCSQESSSIYGEASLVLRSCARRQGLSSRSRDSRNAVVGMSATTDTAIPSLNDLPLINYINQQGRIQPPVEASTAASVFAICDQNKKIQVGLEPMCIIFQQLFLLCVLWKPLWWSNLHPYSSQFACLIWISRFLFSSFI